MYNIELIINLARVILFNAPDIMRGIVFSSAQYSLFASQREYVRGNNGGASFSVGRTQAIMGNILITTLTLAFPGFTALRFFSLISWGVYLTPIIAALSTGTYTNIKERLTVNAEHTESKLEQVFSSIFDKIDNQFSKIPPILSRYLSVLFSKSHKWLGTILFAAQIVTLGILAVIEPWIGIAGLIYLGACVMRANGFMPQFIAKPMEKIDYWIPFTAGLIIGGLTYLMSNIINLAIEFSINIVLPKVLKWELSDNSDVMRIENLTSDVETKEYEPRLPRDISIANLNNLLNEIPDLSFDMPRGQTFYNAINNELDDLTLDLKYFSRSKDQYTITSIKPFLDQLPIVKGKGLGVTLRHMAEQPFKDPIAEQINFIEFKELVRASDLRKSVNFFKTKCLSSSKFWKVSETIEAELLQSLSTLISEKNQLQANAASNMQQIIEKDRRIEEVRREFNGRIIRAHGTKLGLADTTSDNEIIIAHIESNLDEVYNTISTGGMLWEKKAESVAEFKNKGRHVILHCQNLLQTQVPDIVEAHDILGQMAIEAADFCSSGIYDVINKQYNSYVIPKLMEAMDAFSPREQVLIQLQKRRQQLFDILYNRCMNQPEMRLLFATEDPNDRHFYNLFVNLFESFNITATFNAKSDLSVQKIDSATRLLYNIVAYVGARLMMSLDVAYSPTGIIWHLSKVDGESTFNTYSCCNEWLSEFSEEVSNKMEDILYNGSELEQKSLIALMLYDFDILSTNGDLDKKFKQFLPSNNDISNEEQNDTSVQPQQSSRWGFPSFNTFVSRGNSWFRPQHVQQQVVPSQQMPKSDTVRINAAPKIQQ